MTYKRGDIERTLTSVVKGMSVFKFTDSYGLAVHTETHDIIVNAAEMEGIEPRSGDQVTEIVYRSDRELVDGGFQVTITPVATETFDVVSINKERVWYYSDDIGRTTMRIHTMLRKREAIP